MSGNINTTQHPPQHTRPPALNPLWQRQRRNLTFLLVLWSVMLVLYALFALVAYFFGHDRNLIALGLFEVVIALIVLPVGVFSYRVQANYWRGVEQRRALAQSGDPALLAAEQPIPDANALPLPITIQLRLRRRSYPVITILVAGVIIVVLFIGFGVFLAVSHPAHHSVLSPGVLLLILAIPVVIVIGTFIVATVLLAKRARQSLTVTEQGITGQFLGKTSALAWGDATSFAIIGVNKPRRAILYELSGPHATIYWTRPVRPMLWMQNLLEPVDSFEEYERKMQALLSLIEAKTHLPLYDLR